MKKTKVLFAMCILLAGCTSMKETVKKKVGVSFLSKTYNEEFNDSLISQILTHGYTEEEIDIRYHENDPQSQINQIDGFIEEDVDMMFMELSLRDDWKERSDAVTAMAEKAAEADLPLMFVGEKPEDDAVKKWQDNGWNVAFAGNDWRIGSSAAGEALASVCRDVNGNGMIDCIVIDQFDGGSNDMLIYPVIDQMEGSGITVNLVNTLYTSTWIEGYTDAFEEYFANGNTWNNDSYNEIVSPFPKFREEFPVYWEEHMDDIEVVIFTNETDGLDLIANSKVINENVWTAWCDTSRVKSTGHDS